MQPETKGQCNPLLQAGGPPSYSNPEEKASMLSAPRPHSVSWTRQTIALTKKNCELILVLATVSCFVCAVAPAAVLAPLRIPLPHPPTPPTRAVKLRTTRGGRVAMCALCCEIVTPVLFVAILFIVKAYILSLSDGLGTVYIASEAPAPIQSRPGSILAADGLYFRTQGGVVTPYCLTCCGCLVLEDMTAKGLLSRSPYGSAATGSSCDNNYDIYGSYDGQTAMSNITNYITDLDLPAFVYAPQSTTSAAAVMGRVGNYSGARVKGFKTVAEMLEYINTADKDHLGGCTASAAIEFEAEDGKDADIHKHTIRLKQHTEYKYGQDPTKLKSKYDIGDSPSFSNYISSRWGGGEYNAFLALQSLVGYSIMQETIKDGDDLIQPLPLEFAGFPVPGYQTNPLAGLVFTMLVMLVFSSFLFPFGITGMYTQLVLFFTTLTQVLLFATHSNYCVSLTTTVRCCLETEKRLLTTSQCTSWCGRRRAG